MRQISSPDNPVLSSDSSFPPFKTPKSMPKSSKITKNHRKSKKNKTNIKSSKNTKNPEKHRKSQFRYNLEERRKKGPQNRKLTPDSCSATSKTPRNDKKVTGFQHQNQEKARYNCLGKGDTMGLTVEHLSPSLSLSLSQKVAQK